MTSKKIDKKSGNAIYVVEREELDSKPFSQIDLARDLDYSNIPLNAAQNDNLGTVMVLPDNTNILFRNTSIQDLVQKSYKEGLYTKDPADLTSELSIVLERGGGHFRAEFSNKTHVFKVNFFPDDHPTAAEEEDPTFILSHIISDVILGERSSNCKLIGQTSPAENTNKNKEVAEMSKPILGEHVIRFSISNDQYEEAYRETQKLNNQCNTEEVGYSALFNKEDATVENCASAIEKVIGNIGINTSFTKFFLDYQLLCGSDPFGRYFVNYKNDDYKYPVLKEISTHISNHSLFFYTLAFTAIGLKLVSGEMKMAPYVGVLAAIISPIEESLELLEEEEEEEVVIFYDRNDSIIENEFLEMVGEMVEEAA